MKKRKSRGGAGWRKRTSSIQGKLKVGDPVCWFNRRQYTGHVVEVIERLVEVSDKLNRLYGTRDELSYIVECAGPRGAKCYWPRVHYLERWTR